jgi:DNA invertase Pin-like site-specific DNA recombinase
MKVALYARVSTDDKEQNPETQLYALRQYCVDRDHVIFKEYVDKARARDYRGRKQWTQLLKDMRQRKFQAILVWKLDRMSRDWIYTVNIIRDFEDRGIKFVSITQDIIDTTTAAGQIGISVLGIIAESESRTTSERVRAGMARAKAEGRPVGRKPLGISSLTICEALSVCNNVAQAARQLKCSVPYIYKILKPLGLNASKIAKGEKY